MGSTSAKLEPTLTLSLTVPLATSSAVKFIGRHLKLQHQNSNLRSCSMEI